MSAQPVSAQPGDQHWFISLNGKRYGPYSFAALSEAVAKGVIDGNTSVWRLGWVKWHPARRVPGLIEESPPPEPRDQASDQESREGEDRAAAETDRPWQDEDVGAEAPRRHARPIVEDEQVTAEGQRQRRVEDDLAEAPRRRKSQAAEAESAPAEPPRRRKSEATQDENAPAEAPRRRNQAVEDQVVANEVPRRRKSQAAEDENAPEGRFGPDRPAGTMRATTTSRRSRSAIAGRTAPAAGPKTAPFPMSKSAIGWRCHSRARREASP
jgi:hypothetical protein